MECKSIFEPKIARRLLKMGNIIVDIKPDKKDNRRTIFMFELNDKLKEDLTKITNE